MEEAPAEEPAAEEAPAEAAALADGTYKVSKETAFSTIDVEITVEGGAITDSRITSSGDNDLLTDEQRGAWAEQIVTTQGQTVDAVSTVTISSTAVQEAVQELLAQASAG